MKKPVKLNIKKQDSKKDSKKESFFFFVKDQGTGAGKVFVIILKIFELILTTVFAVVLGIFAPLCIWNGDIGDAELARDPSAVWWLVSSIIYIIGTFTVMLGHSKTAAVMHGAAAVGTLVTYHYYTLLYEGYESNGPTALYMPSLIIAVLTLAIMLIINIPKWIDRKIARDNEQAPSILSKSNTNQNSRRHDKRQ